MAAFSITIQNSVRAFGPAPTTKWGSPMQWGVDNWGEGTIDTITSISKVFSAAFVVTDTLVKSPSISFSNTFVSDFEVENRSIMTANGYTQDNPEPTSYSQDSSPSTVWTLDTAPDTTWGEA